MIRKEYSLVKEIWDWFDIYILDTLINIFSPRRNLRRLKWLGQQIYRGWDDRELWSIDYSFAKYILLKLRLINIGKLYYGLYKGYFSKSITTFEYIIAEDKDYDVKKYTAESYEDYCLKTERIINEGINEFFTNILLFGEFQEEIANWFLPRLKEFKKVVHGSPMSIPLYRKVYLINGGDTKFSSDHCMKVWMRIIDKMIKAFIIMSEDKLYFPYLSNINIIKERDRNKGLAYVKKYFRNLWD